MTLLLVLLLVTLVLFALFLGGSILAQGYLYQAPADRLPVRALGAAVLVGGFITMWVWIDKRNPKKYDTFFEFSPYSTRPFNEFEAVRWLSLDGTKLKADTNGQPVEVAVKFKRGTGAKSNLFLEEATGTAFQLNGVGKSGESYMTAAIKLKPEPDTDAIRLNAKLKDDTRSAVKAYTPERVFVEEKGSRYVQADLLGVLFVPSTGTVVLALLLNLVHFLVWFAAFWLILQFTRGHAFALTTLFGLMTMLLVLPLLFKPNRAAPAAEGPTTAAAGRDSLCTGLPPCAT